MADYGTCVGIEHMFAMSACCRSAHVHVGIDLPLTITSVAINTTTKLTVSKITGRM